MPLARIDGAGAIEPHPAAAHALGGDAEQGKQGSVPTTNPQWADRFNVAAAANDGPTTLAPEKADATTAATGAHTTQVYYFHTQPNGLPEELSDNSGNLVWQARYTTWGSTVREAWQSFDTAGLLQQQPRNQTTELQQNLRMQGQYLDRETGLHYNTFRYYDADLGAFTTPDPIGLGGGLNLHQYAPNPVGWIDPWGWSCAATNLPLLRGKSVPHVEKVLAKAGFSRVNPNNASNRTWRHPDGSEVRVHQHGNQNPSGYKSGNNAHVHKQNSSQQQLNDRGQVRPVGDETHIGIKNPSNLPAVRGRPHGDGS